MPVRVDKISHFFAYSEPDTSITRKCYRCKKVRMFVASKDHIVLVDIFIVMSSLP